MRNSAPLALMRCFARLMRWATVASGSRNARAISAALSPPTARKVSATCDTVVSDGGVELKAAQVHHRPHLDQAEVSLRHPRSVLERALQALALDQEEASQLLFHLGERPISGHRPTIVDGDALRQ